MHRLFIGIDPPEHVKDRLLDMMGGLAGARWQSDEQLHLTLRFVGEVDGNQADDVAAALESLRHPRFELSLAGIGMFERSGGRRSAARGGRPEALWVGIEPKAPVKALHDKIESAMRMAGLPPEGRAYLPHITIARLKSLAAPLDGFMSTHGGVTSEPFAVDDFCLYESQLTRDGPIYTIVERYPLT